MTLLFVSTPAWAAESSTRLGVRIDCLHHFNYNKGSAQDCATITGLAIEASQALSPETRATIRLDPFATPIAAKADTPLRSNLPTVVDTNLILVDDYALTWSPRPNLDFSVQSYGGAATISSVSGLGLANPFADTGWKQTAITATYHLTALPDMTVKFAAGNGEGENVRNLDAQQFFGFQIGATVLKGLKLGFGASFDGNSDGSSQTTWDDSQRKSSCGLAPDASRPSHGYSTQRLAAGLTYDGSGTGVDGLTAGLGWQRNVLSDLDKEHAWAPSKADLAACSALDPDTLFVEDPESKTVNTVQRTTYDLSLHYRLFGNYFAAIDLSTRRIDMGSVTVFTTAGGSPSNTLSQTSYVAGGGVTLSEGLLFSLEYGRRQFDHTYTQVSYANRDGKTAATDELFDARLSYNWR